MDDCAANLNRAYLAQVTITAPDKRLLTEFERQIGRRIAAVRSMIMRFDDFQDACPGVRFGVDVWPAPEGGGNGERRDRPRRSGQDHRETDPAAGQRARRSPVTESASPGRPARQRTLSPYPDRLGAAVADTSGGRQPTISAIRRGPRAGRGPGCRGSNARAGSLRAERTRSPRRTYCSMIGCLSRCRSRAGTSR